MLLLNIILQCNSYTTKFSILHALSYKVSRLVHTCCNKIRDTLRSMAYDKFQLSNMCNESLINLYNVVDNEQLELDEYKLQERGDLLIYSF